MVSSKQEADPTCWICLCRSFAKGNDMTLCCFFSSSSWSVGWSIALLPVGCHTWAWSQLLPMLSSKLAEEEIWCLPGWTGEHMLKTSWWFQYLSITSCFSIYLGWLWLVKSLPSLPGNLLIQQTADLEAFHLGRRADRKLVESQQPKRGLFGSRQFVSTGLSTSMVIDHYFGGIPPIKRQDLLVRKLHYGSRLGSESGLSLLSWDPILGLARSVLLVTTDLSSNDVQCIHRETCKFQPNGVEIVTMQRHFHERCWRYSAQGAAWPVGHQVKATVFSKPGNANPMFFQISAKMGIFHWQVFVLQP